MLASLCDNQLFFFFLRWIEAVIIVNTNEIFHFSWPDPGICIT